MHPELTYEPDMAEILRGYGELADLLLDTSEAELVQGGVRLRETLNHLERVEGALLESESRHAFLLRLGDALRLLVDPVAIQAGGQPASRRAAADRPGLLRRHRRSAGLHPGRTTLCSRRCPEHGRTISAGRVQLGWSDISDGRTGGRGRHPNLAVDSRRGSSGSRRGQRGGVRRGAVDQGRSAGRGAVREPTLSPRAWTPEEVELVKETAERTWEAIERARAEEQLREANARKDEFLAMLAHELRNPLAPIRTGLELIRRGGDTVGAVERVRGMMERQVGHMVRLIDDLLDVSRITSGKIALQREPTLAREPGPQRRGSRIVPPWLPNTST